MSGKEILSYKIGFIGGGNMCKAIVNGLITNKVYPASQIYINGPHPDKLKQSAELKDCNICSLSDLIETSNVIVLSVKPNIFMSTVLNDLNKLLSSKSAKSAFDNKIVISLLAGVTLNALSNKLKFMDANNIAYDYKIIRVMPNTPLQVGAGNVIYCMDKTTDTDHHNQLIDTLFGSISGICLKIPEYQMNAATALSGCGPAFVYLIIDALADGGVKQGIAKATAIKLAAQTLLGAAKTVLETGKHPIQLKDEVCSPGGTTITGVHALENGNIRNTLINAVETCTKKANELDAINK
ncbi:pyrroline-5-carboxylate reductase [Chrysoperla carnea]|uniref:pyrroline-5-carboxylate reductase n=1 Tax=Chrysoperla carnea TaxID=189513 RepID=UPI001D07666D|nr:pyrroline-5-carboxylate reductase [Chrysoperla carnea]